ncbi:MAG TPA: hypothetical protein VEX15_17040 [Nocardioidaceae bacterium]|nr:hypothetical protein [Nocardioidaceae bacterium]
MNDSLDDELRRSLHHQADGIPRRPDLTRGAITRASGIRRRRRIASGVVAAVLVAIALPLGLWVGDSLSSGQDPVEPPTPSGDTHVELDLRSLPSDDLPALPYLDNRTVVGDGISVDVPGTAPIAAIAPVSDGVYVATATGSYDWLLTRYAADGQAVEIGQVLGLPVASADGRWVAYLTGQTNQNGNPVGPATLTLVDDETGDASTVTLPDADATQVTIHAIVDGTVYFTYDEFRTGRRVPLQTWTSGDSSPQPVSGGLDATAVSPDGRLVAQFTKLVDFGSCSAMFDRETAGVLWRTCKYQVRGFSPDGRYVWAFPAYTEGYGPTSAAILDAETGELVRRYDSESQRRYITFHDAVFEDDDSLLIRAEQGDQTSLLRCEVYTGECAAAEPLTKGTADDLAGSPYLLPDVG